MNNKEKEVKLKCASCGANLNLEDKKCAYCGSANPNYKPKAIKELTPPKQNVSMGMFGSFFNNVFEDILEKFDKE